MTSTLPNFFLVGAAKSGTTSLYHYLSQHPDVYMPYNKEPHWFSRVQRVPGQGSYPIATEKEYLRLFKGWNGESAVGEASPSYLWDEGAPRRISEAIPQARIVAILRNPVDRAYSHYLMDIRAGKQSLPFMEALRRDLQTEQKAWSLPGLYLDLGFYAKQLRRYLEVFDSAQIKTYLYEDLREDPIALLESIMEFLEIDPGYASSIRTDVQYNKYSVSRSTLARSIATSQIYKSPQLTALRAKIIPNTQIRARIRESLFYKEGSKASMDAEARRFLVETYRTDVQDLQNLIGRELGYWLETEDGK